MLKYILPIALCFGVVACEEDDILKAILDKGAAIVLPLGVYDSACTLDAADSYTEEMEVVDATHISIIEHRYTGVADCSGFEDPVGPAVVYEIAVADFSFGDGVSYFEVIGGVDGADAFIPFSLGTDIIYMGEKAVSANEADLLSQFSDFIADPAANADVTYTKRDLGL